MNDRAIHFIHLSDTHIGPNPEFVIFGVNPHAATESVLRSIAAAPVVPDFIIHTGDVVAEPSADAYLLARKLFTQVNVPWYLVPGNHDESGDIGSRIPGGPQVSFGISGTSSYWFDCKGIRFYVLDGCLPDHDATEGELPPSLLGAFTRELEQNRLPFVVFLHFPPLPLDSIWIDREMLLRNGEELHGILVRHRERIRGVFYGHVHRGTQVYRDGILYSSVPSVVCQFSAWPGDEAPLKDIAHPPSFNYVTINGDTTMVKEYVAARP